MKKDTNILAELIEVAPTLATITTHTPYALPNGYFNGVSEAVLAQISAESLPKIAAPFTVPQYYFNTLSSNVLAVIAQEQASKNEVIAELETIAPLLNTIQKSAVYTVPTPYFASFKPAIATATIQAKLVPMAFFRRKLLYMAAACIMGSIAIGAFIFTNKTEKIDYAAYKKIDVNSAINKISNEELLNYLENVNSITNANSVTIIDVKLPDIQDHIETIPEEELKQYLQELDALEVEDSKFGI